MNTNDFGKELVNAGFCDFVGVPCSYLSPLINWAINNKRFLIANNEGEAIAIASGMNLANLPCDSSLGEHAAFCKSRESANFVPLPSQKSPEFAAVLMQNSGLSNALSPLTSLNHTFEIPILCFISLRGERENGRNLDEPQHELLGVITDKLLQICEIKFAFLSPNLSEAKTQLNHAKSVLLRRKSFAFIVRKNCFEAESLRANLDSRPNLNANLSLNPTKCANPPRRIEALQTIKSTASNAAILATTGKCGRELCELGDAKNQLYMVGSMGCVSALALGVAMKCEKKIIAIDGDSALLMRLGTLSNNAFYARNLSNFCHILLDNESHDSTGGQDNLSRFVDFCAMARNCGYANVICAQGLGDFAAHLNAFLSAKTKGAWFIYLKIAKGSKANLARPKITPSAVATRFRAFLKGEENAV